MPVLHPSEIASELSQYSFFSAFPNDFLLMFSTMAQPISFHVGQVLLQQGQQNDCLYFLRSGRLSIEVDGEKVSELFVPGEVFGEMSLINHQPIAASVRAITEVEAYQISEDYFKSLPPKDHQHFQQLLYRVYASVLSERLKNTNQKAKRFEKTNRELLTTQDQIKTVNRNLEQEIIRRNQELVQKIRNLNASHLEPAQAALGMWVQKDPPTISSVEAQWLLRSVSEVVDFLKPLTELNSMTGQQQSKKVLLFDANKKQQVVAKLALGGSGVDLTIASTVEELDVYLKEMKFDLILSDTAVREASDKLVELSKTTPVVLIVSTDMNFYLETLKAFPDQPYFISRNVENRSFTIKNISTTVAKILNQDFFGIDKYLSWGSRILQEPVIESKGRLNLIGKMREHFQSYGIRPVILDRVHSVTEELLMNAIYDAPTDNVGSPIYNHLPRTEPIVLTETQQSRLMYGTDGVLLAVSVEDPFGSLTKAIIMKYLESCYSGAAGSLNLEKGGAGRGLHMIVESADLTIFNVKKGQRTEVISLFNLEQNKEIAHQPTFHAFFND